MAQQAGLDSDTASREANNKSPFSSNSITESKVQRFKRPLDDRKLESLCSGIADYAMGQLRIPQRKRGHAVITARHLLAGDERDLDEVRRVIRRAATDGEYRGVKDLFMVRQRYDEILADIVEGKKRPRSPRAAVTDHARRPARTSAGRPTSRRPTSRSGPLPPHSMTSDRHPPPRRKLGLMSDRDRVDGCRCCWLDDVGLPGYSAVVAISRDGEERLVLCCREDLNKPSAYWPDDWRTRAPHELTGRLPKPYGPTCGRTATSSRKPCKVRVPTWGDACPTHAAVRPAPSRR